MEILPPIQCGVSCLDWVLDYDLNLDNHLCLIHPTLLMCTISRYDIDPSQHKTPLAVTLEIYLVVPHPSILDLTLTRMFKTTWCTPSHYKMRESITGGRQRGPAFVWVDVYGKGENEVAWSEEIAALDH